MFNKKWFRWSPAILCMIAIFVMSHRTGNELSSYTPFFQRFFPSMQSFDWGHYVAYFILSLCFAYGFGAKVSSWKVKGYIILLCVLYGCTDELHQVFVDGRTAELRDIVNDGIGALVGMALLYCIQKVRKLR